MIKPFTKSFVHNQILELNNIFSFGLHSHMKRRYNMVLFIEFYDGNFNNIILLH